MTDQNILLRHGASAPTQLNINLSANTTVVNSDSSNSVWISNSPSMTSGVGTRIGPLGSGKWVDQGNAYAICDAAATSDVTIRLTDSMVDLTDPVAVGIAVATRLLATGVPLVLTETALPTITVPRGTGGGAGQSAPIDISGFASIEVRVDTLNVPHELRCSYIRSDDASLTTIAVGDYIYTNTQQVPVTTHWIVFFNTSQTTDISITIVGNNRPITSTYDRNGPQGINLPAKYLSPSTVMAANSNYPIPLINNDGASQLPSGSCWFTASMSTGTAARGIFQYSYFAPDGTNQTYPLCDSAQMHLDMPTGALSIYQPIVLPNIPNGNLLFTCRVAGTSALFVTMVKDCG